MSDPHPTPIRNVIATAPAAYTWADCLYAWTQAAEAHGIHVRLTGRRVGGPQVRMPLMEHEGQTYVLTRAEDEGDYVLRARLHPITSAQRVFEIIASNGHETSPPRPAAWGITDGADAFTDHVPYHEHDTIPDAVVRMRQAGLLPLGSVSITWEPFSAPWVHADHPHRYRVEIART